MDKLILQVDDFTVHVFCDEFDAIIALDEAEHRGTPLGGPYSGSYHRAHTDPGEDHLHVYLKNNQLFAINVSGTAHDRSHGVRIPNRVAKGIRKAFPQIVLPPNNLIESMDVLDDLRWVNEEAADDPDA